MWRFSRHFTQENGDDDATSVIHPHTVSGKHTVPDGSDQPTTRIEPSPNGAQMPSAGMNGHRSNLILGRYRPIEQAGQGGFSTVQVAWDTRIQRKVAIKCMPLPDDGSVQEVGISSADQVGKTQAFAYDAANVPGLEEARTAAMLSDPHIVGVHDFAVQNNMAYLIMEYVDGMSLGDLMSQCPDDITLDVIGAVFSAVSAALEVAHENGVLHLDIKPDNVLIDHKGDVKVADFGLSQLANATGFSHAAGGTIGYMPPEQMNQEQLDQRCDEWALASMTYEMIAGQNPFRTRDIPESLNRIYEAEIPYPHLCMQDLDPAADDVLFYALDPDPSQRYDTVSDFAEVLQPYLGNPNRGKKRLRELIDRVTSDEEPDEKDEQTMSERQGHGGAKPLYTDFTEPGRSVRKRLDPDVVARIVERVLAVVCVGIIAFVALSNNPWVSTFAQSIATGAQGVASTGAPGAAGPSAPGGLGSSSAPTGTTSSAVSGTVQPFFWIVWIGVCVLAGFLPQVGVLVAMCLLGLAALTQAQYVAGIAIVVVTLLWFLSKESNATSSALSASSALWGSFGMSPLAALMCGWASNGQGRNASHAAGNAAFAFFIALCFASLGSNSLSNWDLGVYFAGLNGGFQTRMLYLIARPSTWIIGASWCFSAAIMAAGMDRSSRAVQIVFAAFGGLTLVAGCVVGAWFASNFISAMPAQSELAFTILAGILGCALPFVPTVRDGSGAHEEY